MAKNTATATVTPVKPVKASKVVAAEPVKAERVKPLLTKKEHEVLTLLGKSKDGCTKSTLWEKCGAGSSVLGAGSKEDGGARGGLIHKGYIKLAVLTEGVRGLMYQITGDGRKVLERFNKSAAK